MFRNGKWILFILFTTTHLMANTGNNLSLKSLGVPRDAGIKIAPQRGPASIEPGPSIPQSSRKIETFMAVQCYDQTGRSYTVGDSNYPRCLEGSGFDQNTSIHNRGAYKHLQMGIILY